MDAPTPAFELRVGIPDAHSYTLYHAEYRASVAEGPGRDTPSDPLVRRLSELLARPDSGDDAVGGAWSFLG